MARAALHLVGTRRFPARQRHASDAGKGPVQPEGIFRALGDATRLRILSLLLDGELCVGDLVTVLRVPQPTASRHLSYLRRAGLVVTRNHGQWIFYALAPANTALQRALRECLSLCGEQVAGAAAARARARQLRRRGGCCPDGLRVVQKKRRQ